MKDLWRRPVARFLVLTLLFSAVFWALIIHCGRLGGGWGMFVTGLMWSPGSAAIVTCATLGIPLGSLGWRWPAWRYALACYLVPLLYATVVYVPVWLSGQGGIDHDFIGGQMVDMLGFGAHHRGLALLAFVVLTASTGMTWGLATALGEEIGWRGFLLPRLYERLGYVRASLVNGLIWASWHVPILLFADYHAKAPAPYALACFAVMVVTSCFIYTWMRMRTGSLWTGALLHASHNLFIQSIYDQLTADRGHTTWITTEFGCGLALSSALVAVWFIRHRRDLAVASTSPAVAVQAA
jgi:membrane protease YdiL (CAAX protease family)